MFYSEILKSSVLCVMQHAMRASKGRPYRHCCIDPYSKTQHELTLIRKQLPTENNPLFTLLFDKITLSYRLKWFLLSLRYFSPVAATCISRAAH
jgi:hypothetical protein